MQRKAFSVWEIMGVISIVLILAALILPVFYNTRNNAQRSSCQTNLKEISLYIRQYAQDYDERWPLITTEQGWVGSVGPYIRKPEVFVCPTESNNNLTDYWFNSRLAGIEEKKLRFPSLTLMNGDSEASDDSNASIAVLPPLWSKDEGAPTRRHMWGTNYAFVDGHVKWLMNNKVTTEKPSKNGNVTFLVR